MMLRRFLLLAGLAILATAGIGLTAIHAPGQSTHSRPLTTSQSSN